MKKKYHITLDSLIQRDPEMIFSDMDGETVMMSIDNGEYYGLNQVGSTIWELLEKPITVKTMVSELMNKFNVSQKQCEEDVLLFLNTLYEKKLVQIINES